MGIEATGGGYRILAWTKCVGNAWPMQGHWDRSMQRIRQFRGGVFSHREVQKLDIGRRRVLRSWGWGAGAGTHGVGEARGGCETL